MKSHTRVASLVVSFTFCFSAASGQTERLEEDPMPSIGRQFHEETGSDESGYLGKNLKFGEHVPEFKSYAEGRPFKLPRAASLGMPLEKAIQQRHSVRDYTDESVSLEHAAMLLRAAYGLTHTAQGITHRSVPSAGGLFPMEVYLVARRVDSLPAGLYHFQVMDTSLVLLKEGDVGSQVWEGTFQQDAAENPALFLLVSARFDRTTRKYADRGYRYVYMEAGSVYQNVYLQATSLGLGTVVMGAFNDEALNEFLEIDGVREGVLCVMPVGVPR